MAENRAPLPRSCRDPQGGAPPGRAPGHLRACGKTPGPVQTSRSGGLPLLALQVGVQCVAQATSAATNQTQDHKSKAQDTASAPCPRPHVCRCDQPTADPTVGQKRCESVTRVPACLGHALPVRRPDFFSSLFPKQYSVTTVRLGAMSNRVSGCGRSHGSTAPLHGRALSICGFRTLGGPRGHQGTTTITKSLTQRRDF